MKRTQLPHTPPGPWMRTCMRIQSLESCTHTILDPSSFTPAMRLPLPASHVNPPFLVPTHLQASCGVLLWS
jgi:hypothetical protein